MRLEAVVESFPSLGLVELTSWIERRWVRPEPDEAGGWVFREIDLARVRLIYDLRRDLEVNEAALPVVLSLMDQLYALRGEMKAILKAVECQPEPVRAAIRAALETSP